MDRCQYFSTQNTCADIANSLDVLGESILTDANTLCTAIGQCTPSCQESCTVCSSCKSFVTNNGPALQLALAALKLKSSVLDTTSIIGMC